MAWTPQFYRASTLEVAEKALEAGDLHYPGIVYIENATPENTGYLVWVNQDNTLDYIRGYQQILNEDDYVHSISIGVVATGQPGSSAQIRNVGTDQDLILDFVIPRGYEGEKGDPGEDGKDGADGFSPTVEVEKEDGVTTVTFTDLDGEHIATIEDGKDGKDGQDGKDGADGKDGVDGTALYGTCYTASFTSAKIINCTDATSLYAGLSILMKFTIANTASSPTLNVNNLGAKPIYVNGEVASESNPFGWASGTTILFMYDGSYWVPQAYVQNYYGICTAGENTVALTATCAGYVLLVGTKVSIHFNNDVNAANPTLAVSNTGAYPIYFQGAPVESGDLKANNAYELVFNGSEYELQSTVGVTGEVEGQGEPGKDGFSPIVELSKDGKVTTLSITDAEGTKTSEINDGEDGKDGENGEPGEKGDPGDDGFSPTVSVSKTEGVTTVVFTDIDGEHTATINDGVGTADIVIATDEEIEEMLDRVFGAN